MDPPPVKLEVELLKGASKPVSALCVPVTTHPLASFSAPARPSPLLEPTLDPLADTGPESFDSLFIDDDDMEEEDFDEGKWL